MDHQGSSGHSALIRPNGYAQPAPRTLPVGQWHQDPRDEIQQGYGHPPVSNGYPVHQTPAQIQRYQQQLQALNRPSLQPLQAWDRPYQRQAQRQGVEDSSRHYREPFQSQDRHAQSSEYVNIQNSHVPEEYGYTNQNESSIRSEQIYQGPQSMQQYSLPIEASHSNGNLDPRRTGPPPQRPYIDQGFGHLNDRNHSNDTRPPVPQGQQILYTNDNSAICIRPQASQGPQASFATDRFTKSTRSAASNGRHAPHSNEESGNSSQPRFGQIKPARILASPVSPETISWDNPFPTFPTIKKKPLSHETGRQRPATSSSSRSYESAHAQSPSTTGIGDQKVDPLEIKHFSNNPRFATGTGRGHLAQRVTRKPENSCHASPDQQGSPNNIVQMVQRSNDSYSLPSSPWQLKVASSIPSNKSSHVYEVEPMTHSSLPFRSIRPAPQSYHVHNEQPLPQKSSEIVHQPPNHVNMRSAGDGRSASLDVGRGLHNQDSQFQQPLQRPPQVVDGSYDDHLDLYYEPVSEGTQPQLDQRTRLPQSKGDANMFIFHARADEQSGHGSSITKDQQPNTRSQQLAPSSFAMSDTEYRERSNDQTQTVGFSGQAQQSKSQPTYRDRQPVNLNEGSMVDAVAHTAPQPASDGHAAQFQRQEGYVNISSLSAPQRPPYTTDHHINGPWRGFPLPQESRQNQVNFVPGIQSRSPMDSRILNSGQGRNPIEYSSKDQRTGPVLPMADERPSTIPLGGQSQDPLYPQGRDSKPPSCPGSRPSNPDALPEHPSPKRAGLSPITNVIQPKPPPVRQYNGIASPVGQPSISQQAPARDSRGSVEVVPVTHEELQRLGQLIKAYPNDKKTQLLLAQKMVDAASVLADEGGRADAKMRKKNREKYIFDAHKLVKKLVNGGNPEAMFYLADCHGRGLLGLQADPKEAFSLYQSAAKVGHGQSAYRVAVCCEMGQEDGGGTRKNPLKAVQWYERAATLGDTPAMYKMGMVQLKGLLGQPKNTREAVVWLKRAAERADKENPHSLHELGLLYESASGNDNLIRDEAYANQLFLQAAELGYKFSQYRLGSAYEYGHLGCPIDPRQSIAWYSKAAVQEEHQSELALSGWYLTGADGVLQQSDTEAYLWARKAALAGLAKAEYAMGYFTEVGIGATANMEDAKRWYWRASSQNFPKARERLEDLRKGGARMQKSRVSRSAVNKQSDTDCSVM